MSVSSPVVAKRTLVRRREFSCLSCLTFASSDVTRVFTWANCCVVSFSSSSLCFRSFSLLVSSMVFFLISFCFWSKSGSTLGTGRDCLPLFAVETVVHVVGVVTFSGACGFVTGVSSVCRPASSPGWRPASVDAGRVFSAGSLGRGHDVLGSVSCRTVGLATVRIGSGGLAFTVVGGCETWMSSLGYMWLPVGLLAPGNGHAFFRIVGMATVKAGSGGLAFTAVQHAVQV